MDQIYGTGPALEALSAYKHLLVVRDIQEKILLDEYHALPVGDRLAAKYWHLRASASPLVILAHQRASRDAAHHANRLRGV